MEPLRKLLLLASAAAVLPTRVLPQPSLSYEKALSAAIYFYNQGPGRENAFRVFQVHSFPSIQPLQEQTQKFLSFTLKETVCPVTEELLLDQCDFKTDGLVKECQVSVSNEQDMAAIILTCNQVPPEPLRFKRIRCLNGRKCNYHNLLLTIVPHWRIPKGK
ncbi:cathelicidin-related antimicrobial peptide Bf-CRAMP-like [Phascolarctos cinereus]|uniref:Cathelicidin-related peptide Bf-CRAMP-like n=1 Tax=Phascolarctos cinereus TaxID=38626 RepID=A0A6P5LDT9_PHACI|nr:cathelicidin-related peptide Bf-CRAMP-like [Phascolarctos cinereus]